jgi:hypothetical protein
MAIAIVYYQLLVMDDTNIADIYSDPYRKGVP